MTMKARAHKVGDHIDTDVILPGRYLTHQDQDILARHCMEGLDPDFVTKIRSGDVLVAGQNFGCGSSREHAPIAIKGAGIACIVATSFARIFYRNAINIGLPVLISPTFAAAVEDGDEVEVDPMTGRLIRGETMFQAEAMPEAIKVLVEAGGMVPYVRARLAERT